MTTKVSQKMTRELVREYSTVAEIAAARTDELNQVSLVGPRAGIFAFDSSDLSTEVAADTQQGIYIAPATDPTGASGAWVRQYNVGGVVNLSSVAESFNGKDFVDNTKVKVSGFYENTELGGGLFVFRSSAAKSLHDGCKFISPTVPAVSDQAGATSADRVANFQAGAGETDPSGTGVFERIVENNRIPASAMGVTPDGTTDWGDTGVGLIRELLLLSQSSGHVIVFEPGYYFGTFDNFFSDVQVHFEQGAIFAGTVHAAINDDINTPTQNRPQRVRFTGDVASYQRVGTYNCDDVYIERIYIKSDAAKDFNGYLGAGIHFYNGTKNLRCEEIIVENSERSYGFGIDTADAANPPSNVHVKAIRVLKSQTHGGYIKGDGIYIDEVVIDEYGAGSLSDPNLTATLPGYSGGAITSFQGFVCETSGQVKIGSLRILQNTGNTNAGFGFENRSSSTITHFGNVIIRDSISHSIINYGRLAASSINCRLSGSRGVWNNGGVLTVDGEVNCASNTGTSLYIDGGTFSAKRVEITDDTTGGAAFLSNSISNVDQLYCKDTNTGGGSQAQVLITGTSKGRIGQIITETTTGAETAGVVISRVGPTRMQIGKIETSGAGNTAASRGAVHISGASEFEILGLDLRSSISNALRLVGSPNNFTVANGTIDASTAGIATDTPTGLTNAGFMNVTNNGSTNINASGVETFNCVNVTL